MRSSASSLSALWESPFTHSSVSLVLGVTRSTQTKRKGAFTYLNSRHSVSRRPSFRQQRNTQPVLVLCGLYALPVLLLLLCYFAQR